MTSRSLKNVQNFVTSFKDDLFEENEPKKCLSLCFLTFCIQFKDDLVSKHLRFSNFSYKLITVDQCREYKLTNWVR